MHLLAVSFPLLHVKAPEPWLRPHLHLLPDTGVSRIANGKTYDRISLELSSNMGEDKARQRKERRYKICLVD